LGMHPQLVARCADQMSLFRSEASTTQLIGEVGLDYQTQSTDDRSLQRRVFGEILAECHADGNKVISIHSRRAASDVIAMIAGVHSTCILHWFSGTLGELDQAEEAGAYFSVNPSMLVTKTGRRLVARMRRERVLTETDGPYVRVHDRPARPTDVVSVVEGLADLWGEDREMVSDQIMENLTRAISSGRGNGAG
ncbi:MAG: TatD family hydrolase, partial [Sedimentisphaerales bacterium]|nr:TatD family hydrolase [Sedimentisphaerales bacterium]